MARKPYKPKNQVRTKMIPIRVSADESTWLELASARVGVPISTLMREGARVYVQQLERKSEPKGKEGK